MNQSLYSPWRFLSEAPSTLLGEYFTQKGFLGDVDFDSIQPDISRIYTAWHALPTPHPERIEVEFRAVYEMVDACKSKSFMFTIIDLCRSEEFALDSTEEIWHTIFRLFLDRRNIFDEASLFLEADGLSKRYWRKRKQMPTIDPPTDRATLQSFESAVGAHYHVFEGRGDHCFVETHHRAGRQYYFVYVEDYAVAYTGFDAAGNLERRAIKSAFELIFVYCAAEGWLDTYFEGKPEMLTGLYSIFCESILGRRVATPATQAVYKLEALRHRDFQFVFGDESGITDITLKRLRLNVKDTRRTRITVEADSSRDRLAVYDSLAQRLNAQAISPDNTYVSQVRLQVTFARTGKGRTPTKTFEVTHPNFCALDHDGRDGIIRKCLKDSGIDIS